MAFVLIDQVSEDEVSSDNGGEASNSAGPSTKKSEFSVVYCTNGGHLSTFVHLQLKRPPKPGT